MQAEKSVGIAIARAETVAEDEIEPGEELGSTGSATG
jgi:hypothetical protein